MRPRHHLPDDLWPVVASDVGLQGQDTSSPLSIFTILPAWRGWEEEAERRAPSPGTPPQPALHPHCHQPSAREECTPGGDFPAHTWSPRPGEAEVGPGTGGASAGAGPRLRILDCAL